MTTPPALQLVDQLVQLLKPEQEASANEEAVRRAMRLALLSEDSPAGGVAGFLDSVEGFLEKMREQDIEFDAQSQLLIDEGNMLPEQREQLEQFSIMRCSAVQQMEKIREIAYTMIREETN